MDKYPALAAEVDDLEALGYKPLKRMTELADVAAAVRAATRHKPGMKDDKLTATNVVKVMLGHAADLAAYSHVQAAQQAVDVRLAAELRDLLRGDRDKVHAVLAARFTALAEALVEALPNVPAGVTADALVDLGGPSVDAFNVVREATLGLDALVAQRINLARVLGDPDEKVPPTLRFVDVPDPLTGYGDAAAAWQHADRWRRLVETGHIFIITYVAPDVAAERAAMLEADAEQRRADARARQAQAPVLTVF